MDVFERKPLEQGFARGEAGTGEPGRTGRDREPEGEEALSSVLFCRKVRAFRQSSQVSNRIRALYSLPDESFSVPDRAS
jgi:hypothetical protein